MAALLLPVTVDGDTAVTDVHAVMSMLLPMYMLLQGISSVVGPTVNGPRFLERD